MKRTLHIVTTVILVALTACSGGSGSSGDSSRSNSKNAKYGVRVLHAALDAAPLTVFSSQKPGENLATVRFGLPSFYLGLPTGEQVISLWKGDNALAEIQRQPVIVDKNSKQTLLYYGNNSELGIRSALILDAPPELEPQQSAVRVIHACAGALAIKFGINDATSGAYLELGSDVAYGSASSYINLEPGIRQLRVFRLADGKEIVSATQVFEPRKAYTVLVLGQVDYLVLAQQYLDS